MSTSIEIIVNGESRAVPDSLTVAGLLDLLELPRERVAVERNRRIVKKNDWESVIVEHGDRFEIVHFVGGG